MHQHNPKRSWCRSSIWGHIVNIFKKVFPFPLFWVLVIFVLFRRRTTPPCRMSPCCWRRCPHLERRPCWRRRCPHPERRCCPPPIPRRAPLSSPSLMPRNSSCPLRFSSPQICTHVQTFFCIKYSQGFHVICDSWSRFNEIGAQDIFSLNSTLLF